MEDSFIVTNRIARYLTRNYGVDDARLAAFVLTENGVRDIEQYEETLSFLKSSTSDFTGDALSLAMLTVRFSVKELDERLYAIDRYLRPGEKARLAQLLQVDGDFVESYNTLWRSFGFDENEICKLTSGIIAMIPAMKNAEDSAAAIVCLDRLGVSEEKLKRFILENNTVIFDDYSRNISGTLDALAARYGEKTFDILELHPEILRFGASSVDDLPDE